MDLLGIFDSFDNLDQITSERVAFWLKSLPQPERLENYLAQRILYPQTIPMTNQDMEWDLAILREAVRLTRPQQASPMLGGDSPFLNMTLRKILIPSKFLQFTPDLVSLVWAFTDGLLWERKKGDVFEDFWTVVLTGDVDETVGSVVLPQFQNTSANLQITVLGKNYKVDWGTLIVIPCQKQRCQVAFKLQNGKILGKQDLAIEVYGGRLGLMIDGRGK